MRAEFHADSTVPSRPRTRGMGENGLWLALTGASAGLFLWQTFNRASIRDAVLERGAPAGGGVEPLVWVSAGAVLLCIAAALRYRRRGTIGSLDAAVNRIRVGAPLFLVPALLFKPLWRAEPLWMMFALAVVLGYLYWALDRAGIETPDWWPSVPPRTWAWISALLIIGYLVYFSYYTVLNHYQLGTRAYDLGVFENTFFQTLHGDFLNNAEYGNRSFFSRHFSPIFALWFPAYAIYPGPETLLVLQSAFVALAGVPLFLLCRTMLRSDAVATLIVFCYLANPANHGPNFYDVHEMAAFPVFALALFYFFERRRNVAYFVTLFLALSVKEDIAILMIPVAIFFALEKRPRLALITVAICAVWYLAARQIIVLSAGAAEMYDYYYEELLPKRGAGPIGVIKTVVTRPLFVLDHVLSKERILFVLQLLVPLLGLPLLRVRNLLLLVYGFAVTLLATRPFLYDIAYQYTWYLLPFLFAGLVYTLRDIRDPGPRPVGPTRFIAYRPALITLLMASLVVSWQYGAVLARDGFVGGFTNVDFTYDEQERKREINLRAMVRRIPADASVGASETLVPHIPVKDRRSLWRHKRFVPDYVVLFENETGILVDRGILHRYRLENEAYGIKVWRKIQ